jgi:hypothetical protein
MHEYNRDRFNKSIDSEETTLFALDRDLMWFGICRNRAVNKWLEEWKCI